MTSGIGKKRTYGTGSLFVQSGSWYGKWRVDGRQVKRRLGRVRAAGAPDGLTRNQAERAHRRVMDELRNRKPDAPRSFEQAAGRYIDHVEHVMARKKSTVRDYQLIASKHLTPHFRAKQLRDITPDDVVAYIVAKRHAGLSLKTVNNHLNLAHGVFRYALRRGWTNSNPVAATERPRVVRTDPDIRFLNREELEALLRAVPHDDLLGPTDHAAVHRRGDDGAAPGRARGVALAGRRPNRRRGPGTAYLQPR